MIKEKTITISAGATISRNYNTVRVDISLAETHTVDEYFNEEEITQRLSAEVTKNLLNERKKHVVLMKDFLQNGERGE